MIIQVRPAQGEDFRQALRRVPVNVPGADHTLNFLLCASEVSWAGTVDGEVACVFGVVPPSLMSTSAYLWLLHTDLVEQHKFRFIRHSQLCVGALLQRWPRLVGHSDIRQPKTIRWLKWLGAKFGEPEGLRIPFEIKA